MQAIKQLPFSNTFAAKYMFKLYSAVKKDLLILLRDKAGLAVMFAMPVLLVIVITGIQNSTFEMVNNNRVPLLLCNRDGEEGSLQLVQSLQKIGMFRITLADSSVSNEQLTKQMHQTDAVVAVVIPHGFSKVVKAKAKSVTEKALAEFGIEAQTDLEKRNDSIQQLPVTIFYNPVLEEAFRLSVQGALKSAQQFTENRQILQELYVAINHKPLPESLETEMLQNSSVAIAEIPVAKDGSSKIPNATQHNVPAWTIFAMFFIVVSLSTGIVKEKLSGSFVRLKTLPSNYWLLILAKQITYILVTMAQVVVIFSIGVWCFPALDLPKLVLPANLLSLLLVSVVCGWCAVSYGVMIGVFAKTMEQAIGFGAVSVVILAAIGGIVVPSFAMPESLKPLMLASPMHWCMEAYHTVFTGSGYLRDAMPALLPVIIIIGLMQATAALGLRKQHLI
ncbi:MAG: ABC transporter permease [Chitinophagales bacterium]|nr:ABC transporter permease [Chitinophagales bacterium]